MYVATFVLTYYCKKDRNRKDMHSEVITNKWLVKYLGTSIERNHIAHFHLFWRKKFHIYDQTCR